MVNLEYGTIKYKVNNLKNGDSLLKSKKRNWVVYGIGNTIQSEAY